MVTGKIALLKFLPESPRHSISLEPYSKYYPPNGTPSLGGAREKWEGETGDRSYHSEIPKLKTKK